MRIYLIGQAERSEDPSLRIWDIKSFPFTEILPSEFRTFSSARHAHSSTFYLSIVLICMATIRQILSRICQELSYEGIAGIVGIHRLHQGIQAKVAHIASPACHLRAI